MRKEVSIAVIIGIILGAIILYGINLANKSANYSTKSSTDSAELNAKLSPTISDKISSSSSTLSVTSHFNNQVVFENEITLVGKAASVSNIAIIGESDESIILTNQNGEFSLPVTLIPGENTIQISYQNSKNILETQILKIVYSTKIIE